MNNEFEQLETNEQELLLKAPALVSVLAASYDHEITKEEKAQALRLAHLKTFHSEPAYRFFFTRVEENFERFFKESVDAYAPFDDTKRQQIKDELNRINIIIAKLSPGLAKAIHKSLREYTEHIRKADRSFLEYFIFPLPILGITD